MKTDKKLARFYNNFVPEPNTGCWLWTAGESDGYGYFSFKEISKSRLAHRISFILSNGNIDDRLSVCHKCDTTLCINPAHLFIGTHNDNMKYRNLKMRHSHGSHRPLAKLDEKKVLEIRQSPNKSIGYFAKKFNVSYSVIHHALTNRTWKHI